MINHYRVLIVDDDRTNRYLLRRCLEREPYDLDEAADGAEAVTKILRDSPDLVFLDLHMPVLDGVGVLRRLRELGLAPHVVLVSGATGPEVSEALALGAEALVPKPIRLDAVRQMAARRLEAEVPMAG